MLENVCLGQYIEGNSLLHRLSPQVKFLLSIIFVATAFVTENFCSLIVFVMTAAIFVLCSGISLNIYFKSARIILIFVVFSCVLNIVSGYGEPLWQFWFFNVTAKSLQNSVMVVFRIVSLMFFSASMMFTTTQKSSAYAVQVLLKPLAKLGVNVQDISTMIAVSLRFVPVMFEETEQIIMARRARGADFYTRNPLKKLKEFIPMIFTLFFLMFKRAFDLAIAMESRCYNNVIERTSLKQYKIHTLDVLALIFIALVFMGVIVCKFLAPI
jgi:energy-coupling factor transport system permease protein